MKTEFNRNDLAAIKRAAISIQPLVTKRDKLYNKIQELQNKVIELQNSINNFSIPIVNMTGYNIEDLVERTEDNKYIFKYPDTIIPVKDNNEEEENNQVDFEAKVEEHIDNNYQIIK